jgi:glucan phosphoethanolaminetransferase (alkaline phosphatase superfamily)
MERSALAISSASRRQRARARVRRWAARLLAFAPGPILVAVDVVSRPALLAQYTREALLAYAVAALASVVTWGALVVAASHRGGVERAFALLGLATLALLAVGTQLYTLDRYGTYLNFRVALMGSSLLPCFAQQLWSQRLATIGTLASPVLAVVAIAIASRRLAPTRAWHARAALAVGVAGVVAMTVYGTPGAGWDNGAPPDVLYLSAVGALAKSKHTHADIMVELEQLPDARSPLHVPKLAPHPGARRNVVLVVTESVRATDVCTAPTPSCETTPFTNARLPDRIGFRQMRAVDSTTALSNAVMWSGLPPTAPRRALHEAPLVWEYAYAAGIDSGYWTSQNLLYANAGRWLDGIPASRFVSGTQLEPYASYLCGADDGALVDRVIADVGSLKEPYVAVVQMSNTHFPYWVDTRDAPFGTSVATDAPLRDSTLARYKDAIHRQDKELARLVAALRARPEGGRTVIVFLSDHGEQVMERGQIGHTWSLYDEEIHVPMWIDAPLGTLTEAEEHALRRLIDTPLTMLDVAPTLLDLMGVWDAPEIAGFRARMPGESLLRGGSPPDRAVVLTNCSELFSCATKNWGAMRALRKLHATQDEEGGWRCYDVASDPWEQRPSPPDACGDLRALAEADGRGTPWEPSRR